MFPVQMGNVINIGMQKPIPKYENDQLQFIAHEEGRIRPVRDANNNMSGFVYDYFIKDHASASLSTGLGNVRMVLTEEQKTDPYPPASMLAPTAPLGEAAQGTTEERFYANLPSTRTAISAISGYPTDTYTNPNEKVARINGSGNKIGPSIILKVMAGDQFNIRVSSWYKKNGANPGSPNSIATDLVTNLINSLTGAGGPVHGAITSAQLTSSGVVPTSVSSFLSNQPAPGSTKPKAYLNWVLLDEQFKFVQSSSGAEQVGNDLEFKVHTKTNLPITKNGYLYVFVSNETPNIDLYWDNLQVTHTRGPILEETHYYPFGLTMAGISSKAAGGLTNKYLFNSGNELQNKEFSDGGGLELYDAKNRMYDPQLGRFGQIDPLADMSPNISSYVFASNNPISINDPLGLSDSIPWKQLPTIVVSGVKNTWNTFSNWFTGANVNYSGSGWGHGPRRWLANQIGLGNTASNLFELGLQSQLQNSQVNLTGGLLNDLKTDPAMIAFQNKLIAILKTDLRFGKLQFVLKGKAPGGIQFGGKRWSSTNEKWGVLNSSNPALHGETWEVAGNALTWSVRHAEVDYSATVKTDGTMVISFHLNDQLDLSPQPGRSEAYNNISAATGFLYHDVAGGNSNLKVNADWDVTTK